MAFRLVFLCLLLQVVYGEIWIKNQLRSEICGDRIWNAICVRLKNQGFCDNTETIDEMKTNCALTCGYCDSDKDFDYGRIEEAEQEQQQEQQEQQEQNQDKGTEGNTHARSQTNAPTCGRSTVASSRVIAGNDASLGEWPWQAWLDIKDTGFSCGGSLIAPRWVLTASHCILETDPAKYRVILGDVKHNKKEGSEQTFGVDKIIVHENYNKPVAVNNDVTLLKLSRPARINAFVKTVCLPSPHEMVPLKTKCYITGWGMTSHPGDSSPVLQQAPMPVAPSTRCQAAVPNQTQIITPGMLCAGDKGKTKISGCYGDSGGPFVCKNAKGQWVQQGVVSWGGPFCNSANHFTVFARVSMYRDWIEKKIQENQK